MPEDSGVVEEDAGAVGNRGTHPSGLENSRPSDRSHRGTEDAGVVLLAPDQLSGPLKPAPGKDTTTANVWANKTRLGSFRNDPSSGWTHAFEINGLRDLLQKLRDAKLERKVAKLVIVAHGDSGGVVELEPELTDKNATSFSNEFIQLGDYLMPGGRLIFMCCQAGAGEEGSKFLITVSSYLYGRTIIGFIVNGSVRAKGVAGDIWEAPGSLSGMNPELFKNEPRMTEESQYAKWVRDKRLLRLPPSDEFHSLMGSWTVVTATPSAGVSVDLKGSVLRVSLNAIDLAKSGRAIWSGDNTIATFKRPRTIDIKYATSKEKGKTALGILRFGEADFDSLTICLADPSRERPDDFTTPPNGGRMLLLLKRLKAR